MNIEIEKCFQDGNGNYFFPNSKINFISDGVVYFGKITNILSNGFTFIPNNREVIVYMPFMLISEIIVH